MSLQVCSIFNFCFISIHTYENNNRDFCPGLAYQGSEGPRTPWRPPPRFKQPKFTRAENEINGTYVCGHMSLQAGDDLLQWACNEAYRYRDVRYRRMRSLSKAIRSKYAPGNVLCTTFHTLTTLFRQWMIPCTARNMETVWKCWMVLSLSSVSFRVPCD